jgi:hypothetical protein
MERGRVGGEKNILASTDMAASCPPPTPLQASLDPELELHVSRKSRSQEVEEIAGNERHIKCGGKSLKEF